MGSIPRERVLKSSGISLFTLYYSSQRKKAGPDSMDGQRLSIVGGTASRQGTINQDQQCKNLSQEFKSK